MPNKRITSAADSFLFSIGGCAFRLRAPFFFPGPTDANNTLYALEPARTPAAAGATPLDWALEVDLLDAEDSFDSRRIALIKADGTMDYLRQLDMARTGLRCSSRPRWAPIRS